MYNKFYIITKTIRINMKLSTLCYKSYIVKLRLKLINISCLISLYGCQLLVFKHILLSCLYFMYIKFMWPIVCFLTINLFIYLFIYLFCMTAAHLYWKIESAFDNHQHWFWPIPLEVCSSNLLCLLGFWLLNFVLESFKGSLCG